MERECGSIQYIGQQLNIRLYAHGEAVWLSMHYSRVSNLWRFNKTIGVYLISFNGVTVANHQQFYFSHYSIGGILTLASKIHPDSSTVWQYSQVEL